MWPASEFRACCWSIPPGGSGPREPIPGPLGAPAATVTLFRKVPQSANPPDSPTSSRVPGCGPHLYVSRRPEPSPGPAATSPRSRRTPPARPEGPRRSRRPVPRARAGCPRRRGIEQAVQPATEPETHLHGPECFTDVGVVLVHRPVARRTDRLEPGAHLWDENAGPGERVDPVDLPGSWDGDAEERDQVAGHDLTEEAGLRHAFPPGSRLSCRVRSLTGFHGPGRWARALRRPEGKAAHVRHPAVAPAGQASDSCHCFVHNPWQCLVCDP